MQFIFLTKMLTDTERTLTYILAYGVTYLVKYLPWKSSYILWHVLFGLICWHQLWHWVERWIWQIPCEVNIICCYRYSDLDLILYRWYKHMTYTLAFHVTSRGTKQISYILPGGYPVPAELININGTYRWVSILSIKWEISIGTPDSMWGRHYQWQIKTS